MKNIFYYKNPFLLPYSKATKGKYLVTPATVDVNEIAKYKEISAAIYDAFLIVFDNFRLSNFCITQITAVFPWIDNNINERVSKEWRSEHNERYVTFYDRQHITEFMYLFASSICGFNPANPSIFEAAYDLIITDPKNTKV